MVADKGLHVGGGVTESLVINKDKGGSILKDENRHIGGWKFYNFIFILSELNCQIKFLDVFN